MRKRTATSTSHSAVSSFPANHDWHLLGGRKPGRGAYRHVVMGKSVLENRQECTITAGFGSSLGSEI